MSEVVKLYEIQKRPGSNAAVVAGCDCPIIDNHYGRGYRGNGADYGWIVVEGCHMHDIDDMKKEKL
jgi:hypothetical protein